MLNVSLLIYDDEEEEWAKVGTFTFVSRMEPIRIAAASPDGRTMMEKILATRQNRLANGMRISASFDPEGWMRALPSNYDGARLRAMIEEA